jgi:hypothetical protein
MPTTEHSLPRVAEHQSSTHNQPTLSVVHRKHSPSEACYSRRVFCETSGACVNHTGPMLQLAHILVDMSVILIGLHANESLEPFVPSVV